MQVERSPGTLGFLLQGVSARLASPLPATRLQAMRVGKVGADVDVSLVSF